MQYGFKSQAKRTGYYQIGLETTLSPLNYSDLTYYNYAYYGNLDVERNLNLYINFQYRFIVRERRFWAPVVLMIGNHYVLRDDVTRMRHNQTIFGPGLGFVNGRFYNRDNRSVFGTLYWGIGVAYLMESNYSASSRYSFHYLYPNLLIGWQFGFKK